MDIIRNYLRETQFPDWAHLLRELCSQRQQTLLDAHYIIADHPNYVQLMKTYIKSRSKLSDDYCINIFRDPEFIVYGGLQQIYLIVVYYNDEMYVYEIPYIELSEYTENKLSIYDEWITKYRVLLVI